METTITLSPEFIISVAGVLLSAGFTYIPKLNTKFAALDESEKQLVMLGLMILASILIFFAGCFGLINIEGFVCATKSVVQFAQILFWAVISNQSADRILPKPKAVKDVKALKKLNA